VGLTPTHSPTKLEYIPLRYSLTVFVTTVHVLEKPDPSIHIRLHKGGENFHQNTVALKDKTIQWPFSCHYSRFFIRLFIYNSLPGLWIKLCVITSVTCFGQKIVTILREIVNAKENPLLKKHCQWKFVIYYKPNG
jgi:hypothetical protein